MELSLSLKDRKLISNGGLPKFEEGEENSRINYAFGQQFGVPSNGISDIVYNSSLIKNNIDSSNERPIKYGQALKQINNSNVTSTWDSNAANNSRITYSNDIVAGNINPFSNQKNSRIDFHNEMAGTMQPEPPVSPLQPKTESSSFTFGFKPQEQWKPQNDFAVQAHDLGIKVPYAPGTTISRVDMSDVKPLQFDTTPKAPTPEEMQSLKTKVNEALPKPKGQGLAKLGKVAGTAMGIAQGAIGLWQMGNQISEASKARINPEEMLMKYGTSNTNIGNGFSYERQNNIDTSSEMDQVKAETNQATMGMAMTGMSTGAAVGSLLGPVGGAIGAAAGGLFGAIGGLFSSSSRRRKEEERLRRANILANATTNENRQRAFTEKMQKEVANKYGNQEDQLLYAREGVENVKRNNLFKKIGSGEWLDTAYGMVKGEPNSMTSKGELIVHEKETNPGQNKKFSTHEVKRGPNDTAPSYVTDRDTVVAEPLVGIAKEAIKKDREGIGNNEFDKFKLMQRNLRESGILAMLNRMPRRTMYDLQKTKAQQQYQQLPGYFLGKDWLGKAKKTLKTVGNEVYNAIPALTGFGIGLQQYNRAANQDIYRPNTFKQNEYKGAVNELDKLHINPIPIEQRIRNTEARTDRAIDNSLGLSAGQRATNKVAAQLNTQSVIGDLLGKYQEMTNQFRAQAAQARLNLGAQEAQRKQQAEQWDADTIAKAHAAREQQMNMGWYNMQNATEQHFANVGKKNEFDKTIDLYKQDLDLERDKIQKQYPENTTTTYAVPDYIKKPKDFTFPTSIFSQPTATQGTTTITPNQTYSAPSMNLRYGMKGNDVITLQTILNHIYKNDQTFKPLNTDGSFGPLTKAAVKRFQKDQFANNPRWHTGFYGTNTRSKLAEILKSMGGI